MKRRVLLTALASFVAGGKRVLASIVERKIRVTLRNAHKGTLEIDTQLLDSYGGPPEVRRSFYLETRAIFERNAETEFSHPEILASAEKHGLPLMGGPLLGDLKSDGVTVWLRPAKDLEIEIRCDGKVYASEVRSGKPTKIRLNGLSADTAYAYSIHIADQQLCEGRFRTAPAEGQQNPFRLAFGSCFHKIGLHNPNLFLQIRSRHPHAMMLLGDLAVDDRNNEINMHRADYQLRDVSAPWSDFVSNVPVFASWDDHDYFDNDLSGIPKRFRAEDREAVRQVWHENWNNPSADTDQEGIYFNTRVGPVEIIMLDTRSCRDVKRRKQKDSYLGKAQLEWLKSTLLNSTAPFKVVSSGTMWSDYVSAGKDSWGTWDTESREEIFDWIEQNRIGGVLLVSGDRHGARGFRIPRASGFDFFEFEPATLGGVSGPPGIIEDCKEQLFGYFGTDANGDDLIAFGEFSFDLTAKSPAVTFRLIRDTGEILEEKRLSLQELTPS